MATITQSAARTPTARLSRFARNHPLASYFALAFGLSWALVLPLALSTNLGLGLLP